MDMKKIALILGALAVVVGIGVLLRKRSADTAEIAA